MCHAMLAALRALPGPTPAQSTPNSSTSSTSASQDPPASLLARSTITTAPTSRHPLSLYLSERRYHAITLAELGVEEKDLPGALRRSIEDWNERKRPQPHMEKEDGTTHSTTSAEEMLQYVYDKEEEKRLARERKYISFRELGVKPPVCARSGNVVELEANARRQCRV